MRCSPALVTILGAESLPLPVAKPRASRLAEEPDLALELLARL
jgi:hypothetical protein